MKTIPPVIQRRFVHEEMNAPWEFQTGAPVCNLQRIMQGNLPSQWIIAFTEISTTGWGPLPVAIVSDAVAASGEPFINPTLRPDPPFALLMPENYRNIVSQPTKEKLESLSIDTFLEEVYSLARMGDIPGATDKIFDRIDRLLCDGYFRVCNQILKRVEPQKLPSSLRRSFLTITAAAKQKLPARNGFYEKALQLLGQEKGEAQAKKLLSNLA